MANPARTGSTAHLIQKLAEPRRIDDLDSIAARFVYSLRLIALHERARRDPTPELAVRLGSVEVTAKALMLSQTIGATWPETIHISRFCCSLLTHDEHTIGTMIDSAAYCDRAGFEDSIQGFIRPERRHRLWDAVLALIAAEARALG